MLNEKLEMKYGNCNVICQPWDYGRVRIHEDNLDDEITFYSEDIDKVIELLKNLYEDCISNNLNGHSLDYYANVDDEFEEGYEWEDSIMYDDEVNEYFDAGDGLWGNYIHKEKMPMLIEVLGMYNSLNQNFNIDDIPLEALENMSLCSLIKLTKRWKDENSYKRK